MTRFKKVCVIGGAGFVGTNLCQKLADRQIPFEIIDIKQSQRFPDKYKIGDVRDLESLRETVTGDIVVNLAAVHRDDVRDKAEYERTNVKGAANIAKVCSEKNIRKIVFTSSVAVYGFAEPGTDEAGAINPFNEYGKTKYKAEEKLRAWHSSADNDLIIVRPTVIFGEGNRGNVYNLLKQIASGNFVMVGAGTNRKSMAYIGNIVAFLEKCIETDRKYAVFNYVDTPDLDMNTLVRQVREVLKGKDTVGLRLPFWIGVILGYAADGFTSLTGKKLPLSSTRVKKFCSSTAFGSAKEELDGFKTPFALQEGIDRTLKSEFVSPDPKREIFFTE
ncbi:MULTISPECIES: NAD-dependent epimerase/dehydratase family protein [unclassified Sulfitobacter]|uniref:NAD-dependent epimerase/dehydratase family protein n=2 Tax=Sulfitobacter TaxID=60136 RepID=UPI0007C32C48|nr:MULTISPECIES: NAD(P)-dependent oxidoreductase [unclassified Sulfitobacter]KZY05942.1 UDP-N-acetylglucosamine 4-epimerase [Sulfitobacter sp. HI0023]KZY26048.1 UDP-N-acetylglucosamine 4-epimerase [Sulfitobacter sp. HI0040]KZZ65002.1 UDP-N-acetylglucosamine 4-epimerase [Sulfitobacter sp. HI0129]